VAGGGKDGDQKPLVERDRAGTGKAQCDTPSPEGGEGPEEAAKGGERVLRQRARNIGESRRVAAQPSSPDAMRRKP
jgi:hypothetical protein